MIGNICEYMEQYNTIITAKLHQNQIRNHAFHFIFMRFIPLIYLFITFMNQYF